MPFSRGGVEDRRAACGTVDVAAVDREARLDRARRRASNAGNAAHAGGAAAAAAVRLDFVAEVLHAPTRSAPARPGRGRRSRSASARGDSSSIEGQVARPAPPAASIRSSMSTSLAEPMRHGTHLPHDSLRKKRTELSAMSSMQARSSQTTIAPEPTRRARRGHRVPVERQVEHRRRQVAAGRPRRRERLERAAAGARRRRSPSISSRYGVPIGDLEHARPRDVAADADELEPGRRRSCPAPCTSRRPLARIDRDEDERLDVVDDRGLVPTARCRPGRETAACCAARRACPRSPRAARSPRRRCSRPG